MVPISPNVSCNTIQEIEPRFHHKQDGNQRSCCYMIFHLEYIKVLSTQPNIYEDLCDEGKCKNPQIWYTANFNTRE